MSVAAWRGRTGGRTEDGTQLSQKPKFLSVPHSLYLSLIVLTWCKRMALGPAQRGGPGRKPGIPSCKKEGSSIIRNKRNKFANAMSNGSTFINLNVSIGKQLSFSRGKPNWQMQMPCIGRFFGIRVFLQDIYLGFNTRVNGFHMTENALNKFHAVSS